MREQCARLHRLSAAWAVSAALGVFVCLPAFAASPSLPEIRTSSANTVPACVTPERLMRFLRSRNRNLDPRFSNIARWYKHYGETWRVRWDYAFFQMAVETNFLSFRRGDGRLGDVDPDQNNFAGLGTTGGGVPGDSFNDVKTGVLAQVQHLVAYSGERIAEPVAPRTQLKQDDIIAQSVRLGRPVRFSDLARRWAVDRKYGQSIAWVAKGYRETFCTTPEARTASAKAPPAPRPVAPPDKVSERRSPVRTIWRRTEAAQAESPARPAPENPPSKALGAGDRAAAAGLAQPLDRGADAEPPNCSIGMASYGGTKTVLIGSSVSGRQHFTLLTVLAGFERSMVENFISARAPGGAPIGEFASRDAALAKARELCPTAGTGDRPTSASAG